MNDDFMSSLHMFILDFNLSFFFFQFVCPSVYLTDNSVLWFEKKKNSIAVHVRVDYLHIKSI